MSDNTNLPAPTPSEASGRQEPRGAPAAPNSRLPLLFGIGFVILAGAIYYVWQNPVTPAQIATSAANIRAVDQRLTAVDQRVSRIEQMPAPPSAADLGKVNARIDALEGRIGDQTQLGTRIDQESGRLEALSGRTQAAVDQLKQQLDAANAKIAALQASTTSVATAGSRVDRLIRLQAASIALANGRPLGNIPDAPPAVARFAEKPPPTEAQLRLAFGSVQHAVLSAAHVDDNDKPFLERALGKAEELVSIRRGNEVVIGHSTVAALAQADAAVQAGDFPAALKAIGQMDPSAQKASADWVAQVKSLLDARAGLAEMAAHA
ncbi:MAG: COG4223 family protein [Rhodopila sp.]